jgi:hypothetical protein
MKNLYMGVIVPLTILLPIFIALLRFRYLTNAAKALLVYLCTNALVSIVIKYTANHKINNLPIFHLYTLIELVLLAEFFKKLIGFKKIITIIQFSFLIACVVNAIFFQSIFTFNTYTRPLEAFIVMLFAVNYFAKIFTDTSKIKLSEMPSFWFNTGLFLYFSGAFMLFIFSNFVLKVSQQSFNIIWNTHATFVLIMYLLFTIGFIKCKK